MPTIKVDLDAESFRRLAELAVAERRPIPWQVEVLLIRALAVPLERDFVPPPPLSSTIMNELDQALRHIPLVTGDDLLKIALEEEG